METLQDKLTKCWNTIQQDKEATAAKNKEQALKEATALFDRLFQTEIPFKDNPALAENLFEPFIYEGYKFVFKKENYSHRSSTYINYIGKCSKCGQEKHYGFHELLTLAEYVFNTDVYCYCDAANPASVEEQTTEQKLIDLLKTLIHEYSYQT